MLCVYLCISGVCTVCVCACVLCMYVVCVWCVCVVCLCGVFVCMNIQVVLLITMGCTTSHIFVNIFLLLSILNT